ncbi:MAG: DUF4159 domain-containing protein [Candidatus Marinimicrobia bacterium]|nr:DUF4159 domain-containing protein [Candidatus Neomarinimicrobiota bacterium]
MMRSVKFPFFLLFLIGLLCAETLPPLNIARLKYGGGGDWYSNPGSLENLMRFIEAQTGLKMAETQAVAEPGSPALFQYTFIYMNGHGNVFFTDKEVRRLRYYLENGGFLHADDNYGMDASFRREMKKIFPDKEWVELPLDHPIYHQRFSLPEGLPKIHEHDNKPAQGLALFHRGRMVVFYTYECDLGDGWEDASVHNDPPGIREAALKMGTNIYLYHLKQQLTDSMP